MAYLTIVWKEVPGYEGLYEVSNLGEVRRLPSRRALKPQDGGGGYLKVTLSRDNVKRQVLLHKVVLVTFDGPPPANMQSRHRNGVRTDCRLENLVYGTAKENSADRDRHGHTARGEKHSQAKLTEASVREIRAATSGIGKLAGRYGVSPSTIDAIRSRRIWLHVK